MDKQFLAKVLKRLKTAGEEFSVELGFHNYDPDFKKDTLKHLSKEFNKDLKDISIDYNDVVIKWSIDVEYRDWGVKNIDVYCPNQTIKISGDFNKNFKYIDSFNFDFKVTGVECVWNKGQVNIEKGISPWDFTYDGKKFLLYF